MRRIGLVLLLAVLAPGAAAGAPPAETGSILARLRSTVPSEVAWGAYLAGKHRVKDAVPLLVATLRRTVPGDDTWPHTHRAALDALVLLDARVPGEILVPHLRGRHGVLALIVAVREPTKNRDLLLAELRRRSRGKRLGLDGLAIGNLLCSQRAPGLAAAFLPWIELRLTLWIRDSRSRIGGRASSRSLVSFGDGVIEMPEGFPPCALYRLTTQTRHPSGTPVRFAPGRTSVAYLRAEREGRRFGTGGSARTVEKDVIAREWLATLLGTMTAGLGTPTQRNPVHHWENPGVYVAWGVAQQDAALRRYWGVVRSLIEKKLLTVGEARALEPTVTVSVRDERDGREIRGPLPPLPRVSVNPDLPAEDR